MHIFGYQMTRLFLASSLGFLFFSAACSGTDQIAPFAADGELSDDDYTANLYAYSDATSLTVGGYTYVRASGGTSPYSYTLTAGDGSVNSSSGYLQAFSEGTIGVRVVDASGTTYQVSINVTADTTTNVGTACVYLGSKTQMESGTTESRIDLPSHVELSKQVIVGIGARLDADSLAGIYAKVAKLNANGTISTNSNEVFTYKTGNLGTTSKGEIYIDLPAGYYLTGIGIAADSTGANVEALKLFGAKINSTAIVEGTIECLVDKDVRSCTTGSGSMVSKTYYSRYNEYRSASNKPIVTWGAAFSLAKIVSRDIATKTITASTTDTALCPE
jgi:hypothetical protein